MDRATRKRILAFTGVIGGVILAIFSGIDDPSTFLGVLGSIFIAAGFLGCLL